MLACGKHCAKNLAFLNKTSRRHMRAKHGRRALAAHLQRINDIADAAQNSASPAPLESDGRTDIAARTRLLRRRLRAGAAGQATRSAFSGHRRRRSPLAALSMTPHLCLMTYYLSATNGLGNTHARGCAQEAMKRKKKTGAHLHYRRASRKITTASPAPLQEGRHVSLSYVPCRLRYRGTVDAVIAPASGTAWTFLQRHSSSRCATAHRASTGCNVGTLKAATYPERCVRTPHAHANTASGDTAGKL